MADEAPRKEIIWYTHTTSQGRKLLCLEECQKKHIIKAKSPVRLVHQREVKPHLSISHTLIPSKPSAYTNDEG